MLPQEAKIVDLKYSAKRFGQMEPDERQMSCTKILMTISVITGWTIPKPGPMLDILSEQFEKKMTEAYENINMDEVEYAFRNKGLDIKDWGKALNLSLIDEVLKPYLHNRADLSMQEEQIKNQIPKEELEKTPSLMSDEDWEEWLEDISKYEVNKIPCDSYEYLVRKEKISLSPKDKHDYMARAIEYIASTIEPTSLDGIEFLKMKQKGEYSAAVTGTLITIAKRLIVFDYFHKNENNGTEK
jgi:trans-2-enoyl-CoA reductase